MSQLPLPHSRDFSSTIDVLWLFKVIGHMLLFTIALQLSAPLLQMKAKKKTYLHIEGCFSNFLSASITGLYNLSFFHFVPSPLCSVLIFPFPFLSSQEVQLKSIRSSVFDQIVFSWNAK